MVFAKDMIQETCRVNKSSKKFFNRMKNGCVAAAAAALNLSSFGACSSRSLNKTVQFSANTWRYSEFDLQKRAGVAKK